MMNKIIKGTWCVAFEGNYGVEIIPSWYFPTTYKATEIRIMIKEISMKNLQDFIDVVQPYCENTYTVDDIDIDSVKIQEGFISYEYELPHKFTTDGYLDRTPYCFYDTYEEAEGDKI